MKKVFFIILLPVFLFAQQLQKDTLSINESRFNVSGGMGISAISIKDMVDYINYYVPSGYEKYKTIATAPEFYLNCEYRFSENYGIKLEYGYVVKSYTLDKTIDIVLHNMNVTYYIHTPAIMFSYIMRDKGYLLKFSGGVSYNYAKFSNEGSSGLIKEEYKASGMGTRFDAYGHSQLGSNVYMVLALNLRAGFLGDLKNDKDYYLSPNKKVNMSYIAAGLSFGLAYYF